MFRFLQRLLCLALLLSFCIGEQSNKAHQSELNKTRTIGQKQIDKKRLSDVNFLINSNFVNCSLDKQSDLLYDCSMPTENYAEFLYSLFHKEHIMNFLKLYQAQGRFSTDNQIGQMYKIGEKVHSMVVQAYKDWIQVYKPNKMVSVEEMYRDIPDLDQQVLDLIEHEQEKHNDFIEVLTKIYKVERAAVKYEVMGDNSEQEIAEDYEGILRVYFGDCQPITQCSMSLKAFVYFLKELSFYITPLVESQINKKSILISEDLDFKATQFLIQEVQRIRHILGEKVEYSEIETYSEEIAMKLFQHLKGNHSQTNDQNQAHKQPTQNQTGQNQSIQL